MHSKVHTRKVTSHFFLFFLLLLVSTVSFFVGYKLKENYISDLKKKEIPLENLVNSTGDWKNVHDGFVGKTILKRNPVSGSYEEQVWFLNKKEQTIVQLSQWGTYQFNVQVSTDQNWMTYEQRLNPNSDNVKDQIVLVNLNTLEQTIIYEPEGNPRDVNWSPDSKLFSFNLQRNSSMGGRIYSVSEKRVISGMDIPSEDVFPDELSQIVWVPHSNKISYILNKKFIISDLDFNNKKELFDNVISMTQGDRHYDLLSPHFSPSGNIVAFKSFEEEKEFANLLDLETLKNVRINLYHTFKDKVQEFTDEEKKIIKEFNSENNGNYLELAPYERYLFDMNDHILKEKIFN